MELFQHLIYYENYRFGFQFNRNWSLANCYGNIAVEDSDSKEILMCFDRQLKWSLKYIFLFFYSERSHQIIIK